jgi:plasmid stabilization system protein ParE
MNVIIRPQFHLDVEEEVYWLLTNADASVAQRWHSAVWETIELLKTHPLIGRERQDLKQAGIRSWRVSHFARWLIFYEAQGEDLVIYRVRSGFMDLAQIKMRI